MSRTASAWCAHFTGTAFFLAAAVVASGAFADEDVAVPIGLQGELLAKVCGYDRNLAARAGDKVHVLIVKRDDGPEASRAAAQMSRALTDSVKDIGGIAHDVDTIIYASPAVLVDVTTTRRASVVWLTPGFGDDVPAIAQALSGHDVISASTVAAHVATGAVLGFDLVSSKPKIVINLAQAKRQHVDFSAEVLKLAKVAE